MCVSNAVCGVSDPLRRNTSEITPLLVATAVVPDPLFKVSALLKLPDTLVSLTKLSSTKLTVPVAPPDEVMVSATENVFPE